MAAVSTKGLIRGLAARCVYPPRCVIVFLLDLSPLLIPLLLQMASGPGPTTTPSTIAPLLNPSFWSFGFVLFFVVVIIIW